MSNKKQIIKNNNKTRNRLIWSGIVLVLLLLIDSTAIGGNVRFYKAWAKCGHKPIAAVEGKQFSFGAGVRYYYSPDIIEPIRLSYPEYFCSAKEADMAGYSSNPDRYESKYYRGNKP